jgi:3-hydroxyacyl-[acyl-carrier-protein] dehydratase
VPQDVQAGAILLAKFVQEGKGIPVATRLNDVKFKKMVRPADTIDMEIKLNERLSDAFFLTAKVTCQGKLAVRFDFACAMTEPVEPEKLA